MPQPNSVAQQIRRNFRFLVAATVTLYLVLGVFAFFTFSAAEQVHTALCDVRADYQARVTQTKDYLRTHPHGFQGVPAATLRRTQQQQQRTVNSLSSLDC